MSIGTKTLTKTRTVTTSMNKYEITWDEQYHLIKLYDLLRDTGMIDDLPPEITTFFERLMA